jgi:very-short-patch-repair endonuclease/predicted transcriptional regulator of viral defense system
MAATHALSGVDRRIRALAERQHGVVARWHLLALRLSPWAIRSLVDRGLLIPLYAGVYAVGHRVLTPRGHLLAAVLACGPAAVLSHKSAGSLWGLLNTGQTRVDVTVATTSRRPRKGIRVHRTRQLHPEDVAIHDRIPVTSVARTVVDLAGVLRPQQELEVIEQADRAGILDWAGLQRTLERRPSQKGTRYLRRVVADYAGAPATRSHLERRFLTLIRKAGLPEPLLNAQIGEYTVDVYWPQWRLVVELDSRDYHLGPRAFEIDRVRDAKLQRLSIRSLRITNERIKRAPGEIIADIRALAALAG